ncbi:MULTISPECIES: SH3 domain-containing protein [Salipiger]|uniref:SH3 domain-containing protein n=1 Tax=Salipiger TaxID=263377 RepID=UPI00351420F6
MKLFTGLALALCCATSLQAQSIVPPRGEINTDTGCLVTGLDPNGDGFLALRAGPGSGYAQIGSLHNGDAAYLRACEGKWCFVRNGALNGREARFEGWIYTAWCEFYP